MKFLHKILEKQKPMFEKGGKLEKFYYLFEAGETFLFSPPITAGKKGVQVRDAVDLKRMMMTVVIAMIPCLIWGIFNVGYQHHIAVGETTSFFSVDNLLFGARWVLPIVLVSYAAGGIVEAIFAVVRKHPINEGFLVTGMLIPLIVPPTIPLWQVALATVFGVLVGKEIFGGTGMNILNVAMTARAFLYFAYPSQISGEVWTQLADKTPVNGYSGATALAVAYESSTTDTSVISGLADTNSVLAAPFGGDFFSFQNMLIGGIPGSIGETSTLMALLGALILIATGVGSWKIIVSVFAGAFAMGTIFNLVGANTFMELPAEYHLVMGGLAFGAVFMATDPVSASQTETGKWIYGVLIGVLTVIIRVVNPAYPEGIMLAVLFMNVFAPLIDFYVVQANKKRRLARATV
ncbi:MULTISPECIES: NADH:ubiquinone reductase (Na(+)-transporting) subunit B [Roseivirga]|uniref:Na(+)-translocating NADH-quinone reductase subunit B n=1 Tax=Roseivirga thermotolerans TaxID=1758176 RepID=A0ABQ3I9J0_9BACT|nr:MULTISPECIES: NADH:ubiquinone reductase (Na(+)-transporting) subunit B [Roseivirga]MEC7756032.1 NADH:ubiquinone reductase (Na(+)-transporting) subunit B [Bacteroidota bacterium]GHE62406.1 Na(+)-translocating NADH-quinone reductase subunit B [Roseivirga thermotolerans]